MIGITKKLDWLNTVKSLFGIAETKIRYFWLAAALLLGSSMFDGVSIGLLYPLLDSMIHRDNFSSAFRIPFVNQLIHTLVPGERFRTVFMLFLGVIIFSVLLKNVLLYTSQLIISQMTVSAENSLRTKLFDRYLSFSKTFFDANKIGNLCDLATTQISEGCEVLYHFHSIVEFALTSAVFLVILSWLSWKLTVLSLVLLPPLYFVMKSLGSRLVLSSNAKFDVDQKISVRLFEALGSMTLIRISTTERRESESFKEMSVSGKSTLFSIYKKLFFAPVFQEVFMTLIIALLFTICVFSLFKGKIESAATLLTFFIVLRRFSSSVSIVNSSWIAALRRAVQLEKVIQVFDDRDKQFVVSGQRHFAGLKDRIEFRNVSFEYADKRVLKDVSLIFPKGRMTALVGHTGSGKTSTVNLIPRFYDVTSGAILFDGVNVKDYDLTSLRHKIALVEQEPAILNRSIRENITYGLTSEITDEQLDDVVKKVRLYKTVQSLPQKYDTAVGDRGIRLSGGEKQRIALARALLKDPEIFIFDEATSSLDVETEQIIQDAMNYLIHDRTVIAIAHRLATIKRADNIVVLENGSVMEQGAFAELLSKKSRFYQYWNLQTVT